MHSDRLKSKPYEKQMMALEHVGIEISCHADCKVSEIATEVEVKVKCMGDVLKTYKKLSFMTESELKKD